MVALLTLSTVAAIQTSSAPARVWPVHGLVQNEDCTNFFYFRRIAEGVDGGAMVDQYVDHLAEAGVKVLMINTNARRTNYRSRAWEAFWDGCDMAGPDDQPFLKPMAPADIPAYRKMIGSMLGLQRQGVDYPARMADRCRRRGVSPWISLRMNDVHYNETLDHPFHGSFWVQHPEFFRKGASGYFANALDYAHPEVRDLYRRLIEESLTYDVDGLELDFMREPYVFSRGKEREGAPVLTEWLRGIRRLTREAGQRHGHPVRLGVRVPSRPEVAEGLGLDVMAWAKERLVDLVVPTPRWATLEFEMPIAQWHKLLKPFPGIMLAGGLEILCRPHPAAPAAAVSPELACGAAAAVLHGGADAVYLFNYFQDGNWPLETWRKLLTTMASPRALGQAPRAYALTYRDITAPGEDYRPPLPVEGAAVHLSLAIAPPPQPGSQVRLLLGLEPVAGAQVQAPSVRVNGQPCPLEKAEPGANRSALATYTVPAAASGGKERAEVAATGDTGGPVRVVSLEIRVAPAAGAPR